MLSTKVDLSRLIGALVIFTAAAQTISCSSTTASVTIAQPMGMGELSW
jgi:hypothetical protein